MKETLMQSKFSGRSLSMAVVTFSLLCAAATLRGQGTHVGDEGEFTWSAPQVAINNGATHLNLPVITKWRHPTYPAGVLWAAYNSGTHGSATAVRRYSQDGGVTWPVVPASWEPGGALIWSSSFGTMNSFQLPPSAQTIWGMAGSGATNTTHTLYRDRWSNAKGARTRTTHSVTMSMPTSLGLARSLVRIPIGTPRPDLGGTATTERWVQTAFGKTGTVPNNIGVQQSRFEAFTLVSDNAGSNWDHAATISGTQTPPPDWTTDKQYGPTESSIVLLEDGSLLTLVRQGHGINGPLLLYKSEDRGATWEAVSAYPDGSTLDSWTDYDGGYIPQLVRLPSNILVATWGRRGFTYNPGGVWVAVDFTGTGTGWEEPKQICTEHGSGHASMVVENDYEVRIYYDRSDWGSGPSMLNFDGDNQLSYTTVELDPND